MGFVCVFLFCWFDPPITPSSNLSEDN